MLLDDLFIVLFSTNVKSIDTPIVLFDELLFDELGQVLVQSVKSI